MLMLDLKCRTCFCVTEVFLLSFSYYCPALFLNNANEMMLGGGLFLKFSVTHRVTELEFPISPILLCQGQLCQVGVLLRSEDC